MKENNPPLFVKLFLPEDQKINKKQLISLWGQPHPKQFNIIDNPSIINRIANQINQNRRPYSSVKMATQSAQTVKNTKPVYIVKKMKKSSDRVKFGKLNQQVHCLSDFIENEVSVINQSQIFQYKQKMLTTFLQNFFQQLESECQEKANFIKKIWNQTIQLFDRIFEKQNENSLNYEKNSLNQIINLHKSYQQMFEKMKSQKKLLFEESERQKQLIKSLVRNLRERKKQIKVYQGGIHEYNHKINDLTAQFSELKKEHLDILMYGHRGNMTMEEAQSLLLNILKPVDEDQQDLRQGVSVKYIAPKLQKGKSDKYLRFLNENNTHDQDNIQFGLDMNYHDKDLLTNQEIQNYELRNNFVPRKIKFKSNKKSIDVKVQTQYENACIPKTSDSVQCSYFGRMQEFLIKNKYVQTETKKIITITGISQTDTTGNMAYVESKKLKLQIFSNLLSANIQTLDKMLKPDFKNRNTINTFNFLKTQPDIYQKNEILSEDEQQINDQINEDNFFETKIHIKQQQESIGLQKLKGKKLNRSNNKDLKLQNKRYPRKSIKVILKNKFEDQNCDPATKTFIKTQNFIKLNRARVSGQHKNLLTQFYFANNRSLFPQCTNHEKAVGLLRCYFKLNDSQNTDLLCVRQSQDSMSKQQENHQIFINQNWSNKIFKVLNKIRNNPSQNQLNLAFHYNTKTCKNKNIPEQNKSYIQKINNFIGSLESNGSGKKNDKIIPQNIFETFTLKKANKIIEEIYETCQKIREQKDIININFIQILQKLFYPESCKLPKQTIFQSSTQNQSVVKTTQFLKYLIRNVNESYLFKNFLFLCGINYKVNDGKKQTGVININKNTAIGQKQGDKKPMYIETVIKNQNLQKIKKTIQKQQYGSLTYSSEIIFYLDMLKALNCYKNSTNDISNSYTTMEMLQIHFQKLGKYYKDQKLLRKIKDVIEQTLRHSTLNSSKLNLFKCLQIFLEKVRQRKIQMIQSYERLYDFVREKSQLYTNMYIVVQILTLIKVSPETQLKIIQQFFKSFDSNSLFQDLTTFFLIQRFPQMSFIEQNLLRIKKQINFKGSLNIKKYENALFHYLCQKNEKQCNTKAIKQLNQINLSLKIEQKVKKQVEDIIGKDLLRISISHVFFANNE